MVLGIVVVLAVGVALTGAYKFFSPKVKAEVAKVEATVTADEAKVSEAVTEVKAKL